MQLVLAELPWAEMTTRKEGALVLCVVVQLSGVSAWSLRWRCGYERSLGSVCCVMLNSVLLPLHGC